MLRIPLLRRKKTNVCAFWDCHKRIPKDEFLCAEHHDSWAEGYIDRCPKCGRFKDVMYRLCLDCYFGRRATPWEPSEVLPTPKRTYRVEYSDAWIDGFMRSDKFFIYILEFGDGEFYVGHTTDIHKELSERRNLEPPVAPDQTPKLQYLQIVATEKVAELREDEIKRLLNSNPHQVRLMIMDFRSHMRDMGYDKLGL